MGPPPLTVPLTWCLSVLPCVVMVSGGSDLTEPDPVDASSVKWAFPTRRLILPDPVSSFHGAVGWPLISSVPDPVSAFNDPWTLSSRIDPEPVPATTSPADDRLARISPDPVCRLVEPAKLFASMLPDPVSSFDPAPSLSARMDPDPVCALTVPLMLDSCRSPDPLSATSMVLAGVVIS